MVMGDLNAKVGQDNYILNHVMGARSDNGERFVDYGSTKHLVIGDIILQYKPCHKVSQISPSGRTSNQIDQLGISHRFRGCLMNRSTKRGALTLEDKKKKKQKKKKKKKKKKNYFQSCPMCVTINQPYEFQLIRSRRKIIQIFY